MGFAVGSLVAALSQGLILGGFIQGVRADETGAFNGGAFDWLTPYTRWSRWALWPVTPARGHLAAVEDRGRAARRARRWTRWAAAGRRGVAAVSLATLLVHPRITERWGIEGGAVDGPAAAAARHSSARSRGLA